jgi:hypothetical protein
VPPSLPGDMNTGLRQLFFNKRCSNRFPGPPTVKNYYELLDKKKFKKIGNFEILRFIPVTSGTDKKKLQTNLS